TFLEASVQVQVLQTGGTPITSRGIVYSTNPNPSISTNEGNIESSPNIGLFTSRLVNLNPNTTYYVRGYASNLVGTTYTEEIQITTLPFEGEIITDIDGNTYASIEIGDNKWLHKNLATRTYADGTPIL